MRRKRLRAAVLSAVLRSSGRNPAMLAGIAEAARHIGGDGDKAALLSHALEEDERELEPVP